MAPQPLQSFLGEACLNARRAESSLITFRIPSNSGLTPSPRRPVMCA